jgi:hypothetical protein
MIKDFPLIYSKGCTFVRMHKTSSISRLIFHRIPSKGYNKKQDSRKICKISQDDTVSIL